MRIVNETAFSDFANSLEVITTADCDFIDIHDNAFENLLKLGELNIDRSSLTRVKADWLKHTVLEMLKLIWRTILDKLMRVPLATWEIPVCLWLVLID